MRQGLLIIIRRTGLTRPRRTREQTNGHAVARCACARSNRTGCRSARLRPPSGLESASGLASARFGQPDLRLSAGSTTARMRRAGDTRAVCFGVAKKKKKKKYLRARIRCTRGKPPERSSRHATRERATILIVATIESRDAIRFGVKRKESTHARTHANLREFRVFNLSRHATSVISIWIFIE